MGKKLKKVLKKHEAWEGVLATAKILDLMTEGLRLPAERFAEGLTALGLDAEAAIGGLVASGLVETGKIEGSDTRLLGLTQPGRLLVIHALASL